MLEWSFEDMEFVTRRSLVGALFLATFAKPVIGQTSQYPNRTVTIISPWSSGGLVYLLARLIGDRLEKQLGQPFVIENRPGAGSVTGTGFVAQAEPDGYTLLINTQVIAANATLHRELPYNTVKDFEPIALIVRIPQVLVVNSKLPIRSLSELSALARSKPGGLTFGSAGAGTTQHLCGELLKSVLDIEMIHVPYNGSLPALNDVAGGHIDLMFSDALLALPLIQAGTVRAIGVSTKQRLDALPDVPPLAESGAPGFDLFAWLMIFASAKTPQDIVQRLNAEVYAILDEKDVRQDFASKGLLPTEIQSPQELRNFFQSEIKRWGDIIRRVGLADSI